MKKAIIGIVDSKARAESVVSALKEGGFALNDVSVLFPDNQGEHDLGVEQSSKAPEGAVAGGSTGGLLGGALGLLVGMGALAIPGLGPFIAAGPLLSALSGMAAGAAVGGLTGALVGMGIPEFEAKAYEGKLRGGNILIAVHTDNSEEQKKAELIFKRAGAKDVAAKSETGVRSR